MSTIVQCPSCRAKLRIDPDKLAHLLRCPQCQTQFRLRVPNASSSVPQAAAKAAPQAAARTPASTRPAVAPAVVRRPVPQPMDGNNRTIPGSDLIATNSFPPPRSQTLPPAHSSGNGRLLGCLVLACLSIVLLGGGGFGGYYLWKTQFNDSSTATGNNAGANSAFGKWGVIEIGSKGMKALVIDIFESDNKDGYDFVIPWQKSANPTLVAAGEGNLAFAPKALDDAEGYLKQFHATMREEHGLPPERIYVVSSSGLWVPFAGNKAAREKNQAALAERVKAATNGPLTFIDAKDEARLGMKSCVPPKVWKEAIYLDIGSGNVKGGCFESDDFYVFVAMDLDFGSVTYAKKVKAESERAGEPFDKRAATLRPTLLEKPLREQIERRPALADAKQVHLAGGAVWALATFTHPNDGKPRLKLKASDIDRYADLVRKPKDEVRNTVLGQVKDAEQRKKMEKEIARVQKTFQQENLQAGAAILQALSKEYRFADKPLYFFRNSHIAWPMGFVLEKNRVRK